MPEQPVDWSAESLRMHGRYRGKIQSMPKVPIHGLRDFSLWYTPGVAAPCLAIRDDPRRVFELTNRGNTVAIVSDGTRVLGLGDIGPEAGLPVMEGKALLFKFLGGVDAVPLCLASKNAADIVRAVELLEPSFGGINLEDIEQPKCFRVLESLQNSLAVPVWHDDQQGSATAVLAGLFNALKLVGKNLTQLRIAMIGMGAANVATYRLLKTAGTDPAAIVACDTKGTLHPDRTDLATARAAFPDKWQIAQETNSERIKGGIAEAMRGADVCIAFTRSGPGIIQPEWVRAMARNSIVFACANPVPEIWPEEAMAAGARIVATGRGDFPNQINNSLVFPGLFRGVLDVRAKRITDQMALAAARELASCGEAAGLDERRVLPAMDNEDVAIRIAAAVGMAAQTQGLAERQIDRDAILAGARQTIGSARAALIALMRDGVISGERKF
jgi:malate dehydrogenase (oxaloacetate-decarboxylating)